jgi:exosortase B
MSSVAQSRRTWSIPQFASSWAPLALGLLALLLPTYLRLHETLWNDEAYEHGLIVVAVFWWLVWRHRDRLAALPVAPRPLTGGICLALGLLLYFIGRAQSLPLFEVGAHLPILGGALVLVWGPAAVRVLWFPLLFLLFMVPLPGFVMIAMTAALKEQVSVIAESVLFHAGYPIARDGVLIRIGQYRMLVADACSGLNSIYSLSSLGLLYIYLTYRPLWWRTLALILAIVPIAFAANVVRVIVLILLTYHFGDEVGQGFLHNASGVLLFVFSLLTLTAVDWVLLRATRRGARALTSPTGEHA